MCSSRIYPYSLPLAHVEDSPLLCPNYLPPPPPANSLPFICLLAAMQAILPPQKDWNFLRVGGFCKVKKFTEMCEAKLEFPEGWGVLEKKSFNYTIYMYMCDMHSTD